MDLTSKIAERSEQDLLPLKEDLAEWLSRVLQEKITAENLLDCLDNGVLVCKLAQIVQSAAQDCIKAGKSMKSLAPFSNKFHQNAKAGTFFARDNAAHFLQWCRQIEIEDSVLFESDGLVLQKQPREVILCLLEIARVGANYGIEPPKLVKLEKEIDDEIAAEDEKKPDSDDEREPALAPLESPPLGDIVGLTAAPAQSCNKDRDHGHRKETAHCCCKITLWLSFLFS